MELSEILLKRRSYRSLSKIEINEEIINKLAEAASMSPSCYNNQPWRYIFVFEDEMLNRMFSALSEGNAWAKEASMIIAVLSNKEYDCKMPDGRVYFQFDTGMATVLMMLKATELGLVAHPIAGFIPEKVKEILQIPDEIEVITLLIVGKNADKLNPILKDYQIESERKRPERKAVSEFAFLNQFSDKK